MYFEGMYVCMYVGFADGAKVGNISTHMVGHESAERTCPPPDSLFAFVLSLTFFRVLPSFCVDPATPMLATLRTLRYRVFEATLSRCFWAEFGKPRLVLSLRGWPLVFEVGLVLGFWSGTVAIVCCSC